MLTIFAALNYVVVGMAKDAPALDAANLTTKLITADQRLITEKVHMSLIGTTVVQVAVVVVTIANYLLPNRK